MVGFSNEPLKKVIRPILDRIRRHAYDGSMKLRVQSDSIRFRVTPTELHTLATRGVVQSRVQLGVADDDRLTYVLESSRKHSSVQLKYAHGEIRILIPEGDVLEWVSTEQVGIEGVQEIGGNAQLKILVEKDFKCLNARAGEDEGDRFPNPAEHPV